MSLFARHELLRLPVGARVDAPQPLRKIASGGEAARVMLALKACLAGEGSVPTLVFDEVVPALREQGAMDDASFHTVFVENPRRWLTG